MKERIQYIQRMYSYLNLTYRKYIPSLFFGIIGGIMVLGGYLMLKDNSSTELYSDSQLSGKYSQMIKAAPDSGVNNFRFAANVSTPAVVHIKSSTTPNSKSFWNPYWDFEEDFHLGVSAGSGVIISPDGYIVTNHHVVSKANKLEVTLFDNRTFEAKVIGKDPSTDLALVKIDEESLPFLRYGDSDALQIGDWVLAVGNPFNLTSTVTAGIVSAKGRSINVVSDRYRIESFIQTDAAVNPGNSGGALVNMNGELVGINTAIATLTGSFTGYSFAVPATIVSKVVDDLIQHGKVQRGILGVVIQDVTANLARNNNLNVSQGVYITEVNEGSAAEEAGIQAGDVIIKVDGTETANTSQLQEQIGKRRPGDKVFVTAVRNGTSKVFEVTLQSKDDPFSYHSSTASESQILRELGAKLSPISDDIKQKLNLKKGVVVLQLYAGKLRSAGLREGFVITHIDKTAVGTPEEMVTILKDKQGAVLIEGHQAEGKKDAYAIIY